MTVMNNILIDQCVMAAYKDAMQKHPDFCKDVTRKTIDEVTSTLLNVRELNEGEQISDNVFKEEYYEFLEAYLKGDSVNACVELSQCMQVLRRIFHGLLESMPQEDIDRLQRILG